LPGDVNDNMIFQEGLAHELGPGERVETDKGYRDSAPFLTRVPGGMEEPERRGMTARVRMRHETCNKRLKNWNILASPYRHNIVNHQVYFGAIACLTNLAFECGEPLFNVEYDD